MMYYMIDEEQLRRLEHIKRRLYSERRMGGNEMRGAAQDIEAIVEVVRQLDLPDMR